MGKRLARPSQRDFALAAWHPRQRRLLCARDIMGARPLCYTHRPGRLFAFASLLAACMLPASHRDASM